MIQNEIRIPLIGVFFIGIGVPFFYIEELGIFAAVLFALTSLTFFYVFALMPQKLEERHANLKVRFSPLWLYHRLFSRCDFSSNWDRSLYNLPFIIVA
jgi:hypothetical protein